MRKALANCVAVLLCAGLLLPNGAAAFAMMHSHQACARDAGMHHAHEHCAGMAMGTERQLASIARGGSHDCCNECCLGLATPNRGKFRLQAASDARPAPVQAYAAVGSTTPPTQASKSSELPARAPPALSAL